MERDIIMADFDESKHPRDEDGKFTNGGAKEYRQNERYDTIIYKESNASGAKSGALDSDSDRAYKHAELMYETYRNIKSDIPKIAKLTGYSEQEISAVKIYVFDNKEFTPDYDQAQTWDRLRKGQPIEADLIFIKHELKEIEYRRQGYSYKEAHDMTNKIYNYQKALEKYKNVINQKKRDK